MKHIAFVLSLLAILLCSCTAPDQLTTPDSTSKAWDGDVVAIPLVKMRVVLTLSEQGEPILSCTVLNGTAIKEPVDYFFDIEVVNRSMLAVESVSVERSSETACSSCTSTWGEEHLLTEGQSKTIEGQFCGWDPEGKPYTIIALSFANAGEYDEGASAPLFGYPD